MARLKPWHLFLVLFAPLLIAASKNLRADQHNSQTNRQTEAVQHKEPEIPLSVWQATNATLNESLTSQKEQAIAAQEQANAYKETWCSPSVIVNIALAAVGAGYLVFACLQWLAIEEQTGISKSILTQLEIPYVSVYKVVPHVIRSYDDPPGSGSGLKPLAVIWFEFALKNHGRSVAEVTAVHSELRIVETLPMPPSYSGIVDQSAFPIGPNSGSGTVRWTAIHKFTTGKVQDEFWSLMSQQKQQLVCYGYVRYRDSLKNRWISGFCWRWNPNNNGVYLMGGHYYNYNRKDEPYTGLSDPV